MKTKIAILAVVLVSLFESCASHCGNKSWRKQRFVEHQTTTVVNQQPAV